MSLLRRRRANSDLHAWRIYHEIFNTLKRPGRPPCRTLPLLGLGACTRRDARVPRDDAQRLAHRLGEPEEHQRVEGGAEAQEAEERRPQRARGGQREEDVGVQAARRDGGEADDADEQEGGAEEGPDRIASRTQAARRGGGRVDLGCDSLRVLERVDQLQRDVGELRPAEVERAPVDRRDAR